MLWKRVALVSKKSCAKVYFLSSSFRTEAMKSSNKDDASSSEQDEEDAAVYIYDRRVGSRPEEKIQLGGIFNFTTFKEKTRTVSITF